jgi:response regulator RpfG family c-di-GMP phosphodiesterase/serine/threonine protein kinase
VSPHQPTNSTPQPRSPAPAKAKASGTETSTQVLSPGQMLLEDLRMRSLILSEEWDALADDVATSLRAEENRDQLLLRLVALQLLTPYQAERVQHGNWSGLILGNYRVLEKLGAGGMGQVFKAEHLLMRHLVAIKILPQPFEGIETLPRFLGEIRHVTALHHPNIVAALDAGRTLPTEWENPNWYYLVMEFVAGSNLERYVQTQGPLSPSKACDLICQVASGLAEAHKHEIIHRDIKPSNILVTPEGQAKLTDFGLSRAFQDRRMTKPGTVLGSIDYISPEQASDATTIDKRADLYSLGATLFWCLTGKPPFKPQGTIAMDLAVRQTQSPPLVATIRLDIPEDLSNVISRMLATRPEERYPTAQAVIQALLPFLQPASSPHLRLAVRARGESSADSGAQGTPRARRVLIVDDDAQGRTLSREILETEGLCCDEAGDGAAALAAFHGRYYDLVLLDIHLPTMGGDDVLRELRAHPPCPNLKVLMLSGEVGADELAKQLAAGADDYLPKSASVVQLVARVKAALAHKEAQDRSDLLNRNLLAVNAELERNLSARAGDLVHARNGLILALAELAELRTHHGVPHLLRLQRYTRLLAEEASKLPAFAGQIDATFRDMLEACAPLHDIGQVALPDHILQKAGKLDAEERLIMQTHTTIGADILQGVAQRHRTALGFLQMAIDIARNHHESYDGTGYPDRLAGTSIPLAARLVTLADVYDALRSRRPQRPPLAHMLAVELITNGMPNRFDPHLLAIFRQHADHFECIYREVPDR